MTDTDREILERVRRIETRVTIMGRHVGADVGGGRPTWVNGRVDVPTRNCSIGELMRVVPDRWGDRPVDVHMGDERLFTFSISCQ